MFKILVVEDDKGLQKLFCTVLINHGYEVVPVSNGLEAWNYFSENSADLIISDVLMPYMNGYELVKSLRTVGYNIPALMITARDTLDDKRQGFRAGADDYMTKPIDVEEMLWRVEALLRRAGSVSQQKQQIGSTELDYNTFTVTVQGKNIELSKKEFLLLYKLVSAQGRILTKRQIMDDVWGIQTESDTHTLEVFISKLREKFKDNQDFQIETIRGLGYKVVNQKEQS